MYSEVLGISGSPIHNSNTDRLIQHILDSTGKSAEFIKLSQINVRPCLGCKKCVTTNRCVQKDDFPELAEKLRHAKALVIGGYTPYGILDAFTKAFLERLWSMRHVNSLNEGKITVTVISSLREEKGQIALDQMATVMKMERTRHIGQLQILGNLPCLICGKGDHCKNSGGIQMVYGPDAHASCEYIRPVESQPVWQQGQLLGEEIGYLLEEQGAAV